MDMSHQRKTSDDAFYSISKNEITVPEKVQFKDGEAFYGTLFHEMDIRLERKVC